jgi:hypothetical protein
VVRVRRFSQFPALYSLTLQLTHSPLVTRSSSLVPRTWRVPLSRVAVTHIRSDGVFPRVDATGWPLVPPTQLTIHRTSHLDEQTRQIICALDGRRFCQLLYGEAVTCEIAPGEHTLRVHNTLVWKTLLFEVDPGGHAHFTVWNKSWGGYVVMLAFLGAAPLGLGVAVGRPGDEKPLEGIHAGRR